LIVYSTGTKGTRVNSTCRLLYLLGQLRPGGQERQLYYLLQAMNRSHYQPAIAVWNYSTRDEKYVREIQKLDVPVYPCSEALSVPAKLGELRRLVQILQPEIVHSYCFYINAVAWWASRGSRAIPIGSIRQDFVTERDLGGLAGRIMGTLCGRLPAVQVCNSSAAKSTAERSFLRPHRLYVVRNGISVEGIYHCPPPRSGLSLLAIGRLDPEKRWDRLLRAVAALVAKRQEFQVRLAGTGPLLSELRSQASRLGIDRYVEFLGFREDIAALLRESSFLVHTADAEGSPNVILEAMAAARAVVATDAGDVPYLVDNGKTGFVVRRGDDARFIDCIAMLIGNPELACQMGQAGRAKAEREFTLECLVASTLAVYRAAGWDA
jgi:glycosyltransferase involved in cell wall biosynthesis